MEIWDALVFYYINYKVTAECRNNFPTFNVFNINYKDHWWIYNVETNFLPLIPMYMYVSQTSKESLKQILSEFLQIVKQYIGQDKKDYM